MVVYGEAIAIVLDVGKSMHSEKDCPTVLEEAKTCISMIIQRKIFSESKDEIALILFGTSETANNTAEDYVDDCGNISIVQNLQLANWELLEIVNGIKGTDVSTDSIRDDALLTAINLLQNTNKGKKCLSRRILFLTCFDDCTYSDKVNEICEELKLYQIDLNVIGPVAFPIEDIKNDTCMQDENSVKISVKAENYISEILREVNGESYSFCDVLPALIYYQKKTVQARPWNANLDIGNLSIPISAYTKVTEYKPKPWKIAYAFRHDANIQRGVNYHLNDELQTRVTKVEMISAFKYGTTLVPYSEEDKNMDYDPGEKGIKVLGFTKAENMQRWHYIGDKSMYIFNQKNKEDAAEMLTPFIQALYDTKMVAIVRYVYSQRSAPKIGFLAPKIKESYECLVFIILPFMEDMRHFVFNSLESDSKNIPSEEQFSAIDDLIMAMDLTSPTDEDGEEILKPKNTVNPYLQRLCQCLQFKAFHPERPLPEIEPHIKSLLNPPSKLLKRAEPSLKRIASLFPIKETVVKKETEAGPQVFQTGKSEESIKMRSVSNDSAPEEKFVTDANLVDAVTDKIVEVGSINPVRDFQYLINNKVLPFNDICQQMMDVVFKILQDNAQLRMYHSKILSICKEFRCASLKEGNPGKYNSFMTNLQNVLLECDEELWEKIRNEKIGLISKKEIPSSLVSSEQAEVFLANPFPSDDKDSLTVGSFDANEDDDFDDLLGQL